MTIDATHVPDGWKVVPLEALAEVVMGQSPPGDTVVEWDGGGHEDGGLPFIQGNAEFGLRVPAPAKWCLQPLKRAAPGDLLVAAADISVRAPVGHTNHADQSLAIGRGLAAVRFTAADPSFGWHTVNHAKQIFERVAQGSTFEAIGGTELRSLPILLPPLPEQRAIAAVLDGIDEAIERTEEVIAATERVRDALLRELLTRGLPGRHSEWAEVPRLGTVPACWDSVHLGDVCAEIKYGTSRPLSPEGALPVLRIPNVARGVLDLSDLRYANLPEGERQTVSLSPGDLLLVRTNGNPEVCGTGVLWPGLEGEWAFASYLLRLRTVMRRLDGSYLWAFLQTAFGRRQLRGNIRTSAGNYNLSAEGLMTIEIPLPPLGEQQVIVAALHGVDANVARACEERARLQSLQGSAADALLTGRVRVGVSEHVT